MPNFMASQPRQVSASSTSGYWFSQAAGAIALAKTARAKKALALAEVARACIEAAEATRL